MQNVSVFPDTVPRPMPRPAARPELTPEQRAALERRQAQYREQERIEALLPQTTAALRAIHKRDRYREAWLACVPKRFACARLSDLPAERRAAVCGWLDDPARPWCIVLSGAPDRGKSHAAVAAGFEISGRHRAVAFVPWLDHLTAARKAAGHGAEPPNLAAWPGCLVLDDIGTGTVTPFAAELLLQIVSARESELLPTIVTSNAGLSDFGGVDGRIGSRLSGALWVNCGGEDRRPDVRPPVAVATVSADDPATLPLEFANVSAEAQRQGLAGFDVGAFGAAVQRAKNDAADGHWRFYEAWPALMWPWQTIIAGETLPAAPGAMQEDTAPLGSCTLFW